MLLAIIIGYFSADLLAGFFHWLEDRYFDPRWPIVGEYIAKPNDRHHAEPAAFLNQSYLKRNWTTMLPAAGALIIALLCSAPLWVHAMFVFVSQANEIHAWAHRRVNVRFIRALQELGLLQSPRHHAIHHRAPFDCRYCVMSDWLNPWLDKLGFWLALEWLAAKLLRITPKAT